MNGPASPIKRDETVVFFSTYAHRDVAGGDWNVHIHGWTYEPEEDSRSRAALLGVFRRLMKLSREQAETALFKQRARAFLVDNERGKRITIRLAGLDVQLPGSQPNGHFESTFVIPDARLSGSSSPAVQNSRAAERRSNNDCSFWLPYHTVTNDDDDRKFTGRVQFIEPTGVSVISDIDDTIKHSHVLDRRELLANTFLREFQSVPGMADVYRRWAEAGVCFHYVSASPWQLYHPLQEMLQRDQFPAGSLQLRRFRWKDRTVLEFLKDSDEAKREKIDKILSTFPQRRFVLVGDSGERDPELYGESARRYPDRVMQIYIRNVTGEPPIAERYSRAFVGVPKDRWQLFNDPNELPFSPEWH